MDFLMMEPAHKLIFLCMIQGIYGVLIHYNADITAVEGQSVSLQCIVGEEYDIRIIQLKWTKQQKGNEKNDQKIVVFHPGFPIHYFQSGPFLETVTNSKTRLTQGSILTLYKVTVNDSGNYICEITSYPNGSIKRTTKLQVTGKTTSSPLSTTEHLSSFTTNGTSSWSTDTSVSTTESGHFVASTVKPNATIATLQTEHTSHHTPLSGSSSAPPVGNTESLSTTPDRATRRRERLTATTQKNITTVTVPQALKCSAYVTVPIVFLLLVLIVLLYKRHQNQNKMDMPPPFKSSPPPVKYTSVRNHDVPMTDILV